MNWHGMAAIYRFEMARAGRTLWQSLVTPVITTALYFVVFGAALGSRMSAMDGLRGSTPRTTLAIAAMCAGVVPQQPPAILTNPLAAKSYRSDAVTSGVSSQPVSDIGLGRPAFR